MTRAHVNKQQCSEANRMPLVLHVAAVGRDRYFSATALFIRCKFGSGRPTVGPSVTGWGQKLGCSDVCLVVVVLGRSTAICPAAADSGRRSLSVVRSFHHSSCCGLW